VYIIIFAALEITLARPSKFDRDEAVITVMNDIWKHGYKASSVKALSEKLGITRSSFYNAFGSREDLFKEALAAYCEQSPDIVLVRATLGVPIKRLFTQTFREACHARAMDPEKRGCMAINSVTELCNEGSELGRVMEELMQGNMARMEELLGWAIEQGELDKTTDRHVLALALQNLLVGLNVMSKLVKSEAELWQTARLTLAGLDMLDEPEVNPAPKD
jgi:TetR/AcrR family transcriptional repressor of nem operon